MAHDTDKPAFGLRLLCDEPFRVFFPLGIVLGAVGVSHWLIYRLGWAAQYSCFYHGMVQIQGFETCFIAGFLMTSLPKFLETPAARPWELFLSLGLALATFAGLALEQWTVAEAGFSALMLHLILFAARRFVRRKDSPPDEFVFMVFGLLSGLAGGLMLLSPSTTAAGRRLVEQGMPLSFIMAVGGFLAPRLLGYASGSPSVVLEGAGARNAARAQRWRRAGYLLVGSFLFLSFIAESFAAPQGLRLLRAAVVSGYLLRVLQVHRRPARRMWHVSLLFLSLHFILAGLWLYGLFPDYEVAALHLTFIGGFSLITLCVGVRVVVSHCGFGALWGRNLAAVGLFGGSFLAATGLRVGADLYPEAYFGLLAVAAGFWVFGALAWGVYFVPKLTGVDTSE